MLKSGKDALLEIALRWIRLAPVTAESLLISAVMFACCSMQATANHERFTDTQRAWGAIDIREQTVIYDGVRRPKETEFFGPFDIWDGEWWRIPLTVFHHKNLLHLVLCLGGMWFLGTRIERLWGSFRFVIFLVPAIFVPVIAELSFGQALLGFSGAICAEFGVLVVLRSYDSRLDETFTAEAANVGMTMIILGWFATLFDLVTFPNVAHLVGFVYGTTVGWIVAGPWSRMWLLRVSFILLHLTLAPCLLLVINPFWIGRYHWYHAASEGSVQSAEKDLEKAVLWDPLLCGAWLYWSQIAEDRGDLMIAWKRLMNGLSINPTNSSLMDGGRRLWRHLDTHQRRDAERILEETFGQRSQDWLRAIRAEVAVTSHDSNDILRIVAEEINLKEFELTRKLDLPLIDLRSVDSDPPTQDIPPDAGGATEGATL